MNLFAILSFSNYGIPPFNSVPKTGTFPPILDTGLLINRLKSIQSFTPMAENP